MVVLIDKKRPSIDDLVDYVTLHKTNGILLSGAIWPFVLLYAICVSFLYQAEDDAYEYGFIVFALIIAVHIITCLCCYWSVHVQAFLLCRKVCFDFSA